MAYFYVKNSLGTRTTGGGLTQQTGSFTTLGAASVYATIAAAITDGATAGDFILCSDLHDFDSGGTTVAWVGPTTGFMCVCSVDDANCDAFSAGATERTTSGSAADIDISGLVSAYGMTLTFVDDLRLLSSGSEFKAYLCSIGPINSTDGLRFAQDGQAYELVDCTLDLAASTSRLATMEYGGIIVMRGGGFTRSGGANANSLTSTGFGNGGGTLNLFGADLTIFNQVLFDAVGGNLSADDVINVRMDLCDLNASATFFDEDFANTYNDVFITRCTDSSSAAEYQYFKRTRGGDITDDDTFYRDGSTAYDDSAQKVSVKITANTDNSRFAPLAFDFPTIDAALSSASTDTLRIYILSADTLTDADIWAEALYPDGTTKNIGNIATSQSNVLTGSFAPDPLATGTALTTNTEAWTGRTTENRYQIDIDTSGDVGADCVPTIRLYFAKASSTIYLDTTVDVVA